MKKIAVILIFLGILSCNGSTEHSNLEGIWVLTSDLKTDGDSLANVYEFKFETESTGVIYPYTINKLTNERLMESENFDPYHLSKFQISDSLDSPYPKITIGSDHTFYLPITYSLIIQEDTLILTSNRGTEKYFKYSE